MNFEKMTREDLIAELSKRQKTTEDEMVHERLMSSLSRTFLYRHDINGVFSYISPSIRKVLGYSQEEFLKHFSTYLTDHPMNAKVREHTELSIRGIPQPPYEVELYDKTGAKRCFEVTEAPVKNERGQVVAVEGVAHDISERKLAEEAHLESEARYQAIFNGTVDGIIIADQKTMRFNYANPASCKMFGYSREELTNISVLEIHPKDQLDYVVADFEAQSRGEKRWSINIPCLRKDGSIFYSDIYTIAVTVGGVPCNVGIFRDNTERDRLQKEKDEIQKNIFQSAKMASIGELAAGVGHEINNPLAIIYGYTQQIRTNFAEARPELGRTLDKIEKSITRIRNIVDGLRTFARTDTNQVENVDIKKMIDDSIALTEAIYRNEHVNMTTLHQAEEVTVSGNFGKMQQVIINLFSNAKDAFAGKPGTILVETKNEEKKIIMTISDNGSGIKEEHKPRIFDTFFTTKEVGKGTGLGLAITQTIIAEMKGTISVQSEYGRGTTFTITLPLAENKRRPILEIKKAEDTGTLHGRAIVIDDEDDIRDLVRRDLKEFGLEVDEAVDGPSALEKIKKNKYDYILTDLRMPKMSGEVLISEIKKLGGREKIIIITGAVDTDSAEGHGQYLKTCSDAYINKPFSKKHLCGILTKISKKAI
ncbi:MAG TPA: hypothetical protein DCY86_15240 [Bdellovibrionales bacterium]|nr:hypothetical protein [Bdellovibrionales bacterium]